MSTGNTKQNWPKAKKENPSLVVALDHILVHSHHQATEKIISAIMAQRVITLDMSGVGFVHMPAVEYMLGSLYGIFQREQIQAFVKMANADKEVQKELSKRLGEIRELYRTTSTENLVLSSPTLSRTLNWHRPVLEEEAMAMRSLASRLGVSTQLAWSRLDFFR